MFFRHELLDRDGPLRDAWLSFSRARALSKSQVEASDVQGERRGGALGPGRPAPACARPRQHASQRASAMQRRRPRARACITRRPAPLPRWRRGPAAAAARRRARGRGEAAASRTRHAAAASRTAACAGRAAAASAVHKHMHPAARRTLTPARRARARHCVWWRLCCAAWSPSTTARCAAVNQLHAAAFTLWAEKQSLNLYKSTVLHMNTHTQAYIHTG